MAIKNLRVTVEEVRGFCDMPMRPGDYFELHSGALVFPEGGRFCMWAMQSVMPFLPARQRAGGDPNDWVPRVERFICPDPDGGVVLKIEVINDDGSVGTTPAASAAPSASAAVPQANAKRLVANPLKCTGCRACELVCSYTHFKEYLPHQAHIQIVTDDEACTDTPMTCHQCGHAKCLAACQFGAISRHESGGILIDTEACTGCGACAEACPFTAMKLRNGKASVCDLCLGKPACIERCPTGALSLRTLKGKGE